MSDYTAPQPDHTEADPAPDEATPHETAVVHMMNAVEQIASILSHAQSAVPALMGMGAQIAALFGHIGNARKALNPPSDPPAA